MPFFASLTSACRFRSLACTWMLSSYHTIPEPNALVVYRPAGLVSENEEKTTQAPVSFSCAFPGVELLVVLYASGGPCNSRGRKRKQKLKTRNIYPSLQRRGRYFIIQKLLPNAENLTKILELDVSQI